MTTRKKKPATKPKPKAERRKPAGKAEAKAYAGPERRVAPKQAPVEFERQPLEAFAEKAYLDYSM